MLRFQGLGEISKLLTNIFSTKTKRVVQIIRMAVS